jgi:Fe-S-cluster containining protein
MKNALKMPAGAFIDTYTIVIKKEKHLIPMVVLKMNEETKRCPFVSEKGCAIYENRPWPCRMFPLDMNDDGTFAIIAAESLCQGFKEDQKLVISEWLLEQGVPVYDEMNALFNEVTSPLRAQEFDIDNPQIYQMTFMALYNLDKFRDFIFKSTFLDRFAVDEVTIEKIKRRDIELLKFAFDWIKFGVFGQKLFQIKPEAMPKDAKEEQS